MASLLTGFICWLFLGSFSSTFNILLAIPTSIVGAFTVMYFMGFTLNTFTLLALTLSIGIVVDDAIMMLENIVRHREMGKSRIRAAFDGAREISTAATITTIAIVAIFAPVIFIKGVIGKFFFQFGIAMTATVLLSLLEALTITPMRCASFLDTSPRTSWLGRTIEAGLHKIMLGYQASLRFVLNYRIWVVVLSGVFFVGSLLTNKLLRKEFIPAQDQGLFIIRAETPVGSSIEFTDNKMKEVEKFLAGLDTLRRYYVAIGRGGDVNSAFAFITVKDKGSRPMNPKTHKEWTQAELMNYCRAELNKIKDLHVIIQDLSSRGFSTGRGFPVEFTVTGPDWDKLADLSEKLKKQLTDTGLMNDIDTDFRIGMPEVQVVPDREKAGMRAVNTFAIGQTVNTLVGGVVAGRYTKGAHRYDIRVRLLPDGRTNKDQINDLYVRNLYGESVKMSEVMKISEHPTPQLVARRNRQRAITFYANVAPGKSQQAAMDEVEKIGKTLPLGFQVETSGNSKTTQESFQGLLVALVLGIAVAYMVLASQFNSFIHPLTVLVALPFSISGAFFALWIAGQSLNIYSMIGLLLLMGIAKKNSILLVEFTNQVREHDPKKSVKDALIEACPVRLRPILMTSFATVAGAIPGALALGAGSETTIPMAVTVIGGVTVSTVLTLFVVPCVYSLLSRFEKHGQDEELAGLGSEIKLTESHVPKT